MEGTHSHSHSSLPPNNPCNNRKTLRILYYSTVKKIEELTANSHLNKPDIVETWLDKDITNCEVDIPIALPWPDLTEIDVVEA